MRKQFSKRIIERHTIDFRQAQSSTKGLPVDLTLLITFKPFSDPKISLAMSSMLWSTCMRCDITSSHCFWASIFSEEPCGDDRYCNARKTRETSNRSIVGKKIQNWGCCIRTKKKIWVVNGLKKWSINLSPEINKVSIALIHSSWEWWQWVITSESEIFISRICAHVYVKEFIVEI